MLPGVEPCGTREPAAAAQAGITEFDCGAATGMLGQDATAAPERLASSLPRVHVALPPAGAIVADTGAALRRFDPAGRRFSRWAPARAARAISSGCSRSGCAARAGS